MKNIPQSHFALGVRELKYLFHNRYHSMTGEKESVMFKDQSVINSWVTFWYAIIIFNTKTCFRVILCISFEF